VKLPDPFYASGEHVEVDLPGARVLFTTRLGGVSWGPYATLNLGRFTDDDPRAVERNRELVQERVGVELAYARQVHGSRVLRVSAPRDEAAELPHADGHATAAPGVAPMVLTADCLPVAVAGAAAVAMLHAGWRGLAADVLAEGVRAVQELGGSENGLIAVIGPGARACCYEAGKEVHAAFAGLPVSTFEGSKLDMAAIARHQLTEAGVGVVNDCGLCTICSEDPPFFSHRRDGGVTGRQAGIAWLT
jgi:YfiH family protein